MKKSLYIIITTILIISSSCQPQNSNDENMIKQENLTNEKMRQYKLLECMYSDSYFPRFLVDKCKVILLDLCYTIESEKPSNLKELYRLTQASTNDLNDLQDDFYANGSEIETGARECLADNFEFISQAYGFDADIEELIATRDW